MVTLPNFTASAASHHVNHSTTFPSDSTTSVKNSIVADAKSKLHNENEIVSLAQANIRRHLALISTSGLHRCLGSIRPASHIASDLLLTILCYVTIKVLVLTPVESRGCDPYLDIPKTSNQSPTIPN